MSLQWPAPDYATAGLNVAAPCGLPEFFPISPATTAEYAFRQPFMQLQANFAPTALDTAHPSAGLTPSYSDFFLVKEDERKDVGNGLVRWTRTYAKVPASYNDYESFAYHFIGYQGVWTSNTNWESAVNITGRPRVTRLVMSRVANEFFHTAIPQTDIASISAQRYLFGGALDCDFLADASTVGTLYFPATAPSLTDYKALVAAKTEIVAEDSRIERMFGSGNLWVRKTRYVVAL